MDEIQRKAKRVKPLIRAKQASLDHEAKVLQTIRNEKRAVMTELKRYERLYIQGVDLLNVERQSPTRESLEIKERGVDHYKHMWYQSLRKMREMESRERSQLSQLLLVRQELRSIEMLEERYHAQIKNLEREREQKTNDDAAIRSFNRN